MIKKILLPLLLIAVLSACNNEKEQERKLFDSILKAHDKVMGDDGMIMKVKANIKSLQASKPALKDSATIYLKKLDDNDESMMAWMNKFNPDITGKSHEFIMSYLTSQKKDIMRIDSQITLDTRQAAGFYNRNK